MVMYYIIYINQFSKITFGGVNIHASDESMSSDTVRIDAMGELKSSLHDQKLPVGWVRAQSQDDAVAFRHGKTGLILEVIRTETELGSPGLNLGRGWELRYRRRIGEARSVRSIVQVTTVTTAVDALFSCMERITETDRTADIDREVDLHDLFDDITLPNAVPPASDENHCGNEYRDSQNSP
jgi:hypothetical protein